MLVIEHARVATMTGPQAGAADAPLAIVEHGAVACEDDRITYVGRASGAPSGGERIDAQGALLAPGLIDPHTRLIFAGDRAREHAQRLAGATYGEIGQAGGGIRSTVEATRAASDDQLLAGARERLARLVRRGVTTVEVKTGYGLSVHQELRLLRIARAAGRRAGCEVLPTLLALHAVPPDSDRIDWLRAVVQELIPEAAREGARGCDAFLEKGAFDADECRTALEAGGQAGLVCPLHAGQMSPSGGGQLGAGRGCASAEHLAPADPEG